MNNATCRFLVSELDERELIWIRAKFDNEYCHELTLTIGPWLAAACDDELADRCGGAQITAPDLESMKWHAGAVLDALRMVRRLRDELMSEAAYRLWEGLEDAIWRIMYHQLRHLDETAAELASDRLWLLLMPCRAALAN